MAHYAKVENGVVTSVIVADEDQIESLKSVLGGEWLQTSYNTRAGVHYGDDGQPDGGVALRYNYARIGGYYDAVRDIFHTTDVSQVNDLYYVEDKYLEVFPILKNQASVPPGRYLNKDKPQVYMTPEGMAAMGEQTLANLNLSLGLQFVTDPRNAVMCLPVSQADLLAMMQNPDAHDILPASLEALGKVCDRLHYSELGLRSVPVWQAKTQDEVLALPEGGFFVQRRFNTAKDTESVFNSTTWASKEAFVAAADNAFWLEQENPNPLYGEFVFMPLLDKPFTDVDIRFSVNDNGDIFVFSTMQMVHDAYGGLGRWIPYTEDCSEIIAQIELAVKTLDLKRGFHHLQFAPYQGHWSLLDWYPRLTGAHVQLFPGVQPLLDDAFLHMLDMPLQGRGKFLHQEQRCYRSQRLGRDVKTLVGSHGLFCIWKGDVLQQVCTIGGSAREVELRFDALDRDLVTYGK